MATDLFLESTSIASVLTNNASKGIIAIGVTILMISGEFDLSVGSVVGATAMVYMTGMTEGFLGIIDPQPMLIAAIVALLYASLLGLINGLVFLTTGIPSFIVTLGTLFAYRAISLVAISGGRILRYRDYYSDFPQAYLPRWFFLLLAIGGLLVVGYIAYRILPDYWARTRSLWARRHNNGSFGTTTALIMGVASVLTTLLIIVVIVWLVAVGLYHLDHWGTTQQVGGFDIANGRFVFTLDQVTEPIRPLLDPIEDLTGISFHVNIPVTANFRMAIVWWILAVILFQIILMNTPYGNSVFAVGGNINAATAQGINAGRVKVQNFVLTAFLAGIAAVLETSRNPGVDPLFGNGWELEVIAMTVIGGALLTGGYGSIIGTMLGVLIFGMLQTGLVLVGMDSRMFGGVVGVIMVVAVVLNNVSKSQRGMNFSWISGMFRSITASR